MPLRGFKGSSAHVANFSLPPRSVVDIAGAYFELLGAQRSCRKTVRLVATYLVKADGVKSVRFDC